MMSEPSESMMNEPMNAIVIFGNTGVGKTTLYNYLCDSNEKAGDQDTPITNKCATSLLVGKNDACAVDSPGFCDPDISDREIRSMVFKSLGKSKVISMVLIVVKYAYERANGAILTLLKNLKAYNPDLNGVVRFLVTSKDGEDYVKKRHPGYKYIRLPWNEGYDFDRSIIINEMRTPGINVRVNPLTCRRCTGHFFTEDEEECWTHHLHYDHYDRNHTMISSKDPDTVTTKYLHRRCHKGHWGGFLHGWSCCGHGKGNFTHNHEDCITVTLEPYYETTTGATRHFCSGCGSSSAVGNCSRGCDCGTAGCRVSCVSCKATAARGKLTVKGCVNSHELHEK